ncbi:MAG: 30S ribosomal protein S15 [Bdellovibrionales bacterium]|nr:30S ribosomal protein S15 [Bdellovibrionales bacterium]
MALHKEEKQQIIQHFKGSELDTGSSEVQIALLTFRINRLTEHFKTHKKDYHGQRGLVRMVNRRRKLLDYLKSKKEENYTKIISELGLRK